MSDRGDDDGDRRNRFLDGIDIALTGSDLLTGLRETLAVDARSQLDPTALKRSLSELPNLDADQLRVSTLDSDVVPGSLDAVPESETLSGVDTEAVAEAGDRVVGVSTAAGEQAGRVLVETGSGTAEIVVEQGDGETVEVVAEAVAAALDAA
jgi:hypothetical protein